MLDSLLEAAKALVHIVTPLNLFIVSFIEAIFFPVPPDVVLIPLVLMRPEEGLLFAFLATVASVMGATVGYFLGKRGGRPLLRRFVSSERIVQAEQLLGRYDVWAIAVAGFTPVPYKVFALAAGTLLLNWKRFVIVSFLSRFARFGLIAFLLMLYGAQIADFIQQNFEWLTIGLTVLVIFGYCVYRTVARRRTGGQKS